MNFNLIVDLIFANQVDRGHLDGFKFLEREGMGPSFSFAGTFHVMKSVGGSLRGVGKATIFTCRLK